MARSQHRSRKCQDAYRRRVFAGSSGQLWLGDVVAYGDSLTAGGTTKYPAVLASATGRAVVNSGIPGQTSTQIAARQGGVPITVSLDGSDVNAKAAAVQTWNYTFDSSVQGWANVAGSGTLTVVNSQLARVGATEASGGAAVALGKTIPAGNTLAYSFDVVSPDSTYAFQANLYSSTGGGGVSQTTGVNYSTAGAKSGELTVTGASALAFGLRFTGGSGVAKSFTIDNVTLNEYAPYTADAVTAKNINILVNNGAFTGSANGSVVGVAGTMSTDASGNWTFARSGSGVAVACPPSSQFILSDAVAYKNSIQLLWYGRNDVGTGAGWQTTVKSNLAASVSYMGHSHYLVLSVMPSGGDSGATLTELAALNAELASLYGVRFVNILAMLQQHGDGSANDLADIAAGLTPRSLRVDAVHLTDAGYQFVGDYVAQALTAIRS